MSDAPYKINNRHGFTSLSHVANELASRKINTSVIAPTSLYSDYSVLTTITGGTLGNINQLVG